MPALRQSNRLQAAAAPGNAKAATAPAAGENKQSRKQLLQQWKEQREKASKENVPAPAAAHPAVQPKGSTVLAARKPAAAAAANKIRAQRALKARVDANPSYQRRRPAVDEQKVKEAGLKKVAPGTPIAALKRKIQEARTPREPEAQEQYEEQSRDDAEQQQLKRHRVSPTEQDNAPSTVENKPVQISRPAFASTAPVRPASATITAAAPESPGVTKVLLEAKRLYQVCSADIARIFMDESSKRPEVVSSIAFWMFWAEQEAHAASPDPKFVQSVLNRATEHVDSAFFAVVDAARTRIEQQLAGTMLERELLQLESPHDHSDGLDVLHDCHNDSFKSDADTSVDPTKRLNFGADDDHDVSTEQFPDGFLDTTQNEAENSYRRLEEEIAQLTEATIAAGSATKSENSFTRPRSPHKDASLLDGVFANVSVAALRSNFEHSAKSDKSVRSTASTEKRFVGGVELPGMADERSVNLSARSDSSMLAADVSENPLSSYLGSDDDSEEELSVSMERRSPRSVSKQADAAKHRVSFQEERNTPSNVANDFVAAAPTEPVQTQATKKAARKGVRFNDDVDGHEAPNSTRKPARTRKGTPHHSRVRSTDGVEDQSTPDAHLVATVSSSGSKAASSTPKARKRTREVTFNDVPEEIFVDTYGTYFEQEAGEVSASTPARRSRRISGRVQTPAARKAEA